MKWPVFVACACLLLGYGLGSAQGTFKVYGHGNSSCGEWTSQRRSERAVQTNATWVAGFVSGAGYGSSRPLRETDTAGIIAWMDARCAAHPLEAIAEAAAALVVEMTKH